MNFIRAWHARQGRVNRRRTGYYRITCVLELTVNSTINRRLSQISFVWLGVFCVAFSHWPGAYSPLYHSKLSVLITATTTELHRGLMLLTLWPNIIVKLAHREVIKYELRSHFIAKNKFLIYNVIPLGRLACTSAYAYVYLSFFCFYSSCASVCVCICGCVYVTVHGVTHL